MPFASIPTTEPIAVASKAFTEMALSGVCQVQSSLTIFYWYNIDFLEAVLHVFVAMKNFS